MFGRQRFLATLSLELLPFLLSSFAVEPIASPDSILIRPIAVYQSLIKGVHDYFNNTCVILLRGSTRPIEEEGMEQLDGLLALQRYFSGSLNIRTAIMDFQMFKNRVGSSVDPSYTRFLSRSFAYLVSGGENLSSDQEAVVRVAERSGGNETAIRFGFQVDRNGLSDVVALSQGREQCRGGFDERLRAVRLCADGRPEEHRRSW